VTFPSSSWPQNAAWLLDSPTRKSECHRRISLQSYVTVRQTDATISQPTILKKTTSPPSLILLPPLRHLICRTICFAVGSLLAMLIRQGLGRCPGRDWDPRPRSHHPRGRGKVGRREFVEARQNRDKNHNIRRSLYRSGRRSLDSKLWLEASEEKYGPLDQARRQTAVFLCDGKATAMMEHKGNVSVTGPRSAMRNV